MTVRLNHGPCARSVAIIVFGLLCFYGATAQVLEKDLHRMIGIQAWSLKEVNALEKGEIVVRSIENDGNQELASIGVLRIRNLPAISMDKFRDSLSQKASQERKTGGRFSELPTLEDLRTLDLESDALDQLKKCTVGKCDLNLSAEGIMRFKREIDWTSSSSKSDATQLMAEILVAYVRDYLARGDSSLGTYDNRRKTVDLAASHRSLLSSSSLISSLAPEFLEYLQEFPGAKLENVESSMHWSVVDLGLKPSITISHTAAYTQKRGEYEQHFVASKQIYSSRYLDSSLTFTMLLPVVTANGVDAYLLFVDRSRSDALEGRIGRFARDIVQKEAMGKIKTFLDKAQLRLLAVGEAERKTNSAATEDESSETWVAAIRQRPIATTIAGLIVAVALFLLLWQRRRASRVSLKGTTFN